MSLESRITRRRFLRDTAAGATSLSLLPALVALAQQNSPYRPFRMGIQSYSLRGYNVDEALEHTKKFGLRFWESFPAHVPLTTEPAKVDEIKSKLATAGIRMVAHGVSAFTADDAANRKIFEAAKALGVRTLSADPTPDSFDSLDKLVAEFEINIAIHNHGPGARYDKIQQIMDAIKGRHQRIGACADLGHYLRSGEDPVKAIEAFENRLYGVHLKDVKGKTTFTILGKGDMDVVGVFKALKAQNYRGLVALEYEENPKDPIADIEACLAAARDAIAKVA
jgi:inosose dehydratase